MKRILISFTLLLLAHSALSAATLKGRVRDAETGEPLPGANVYLENADRGTSTGLDGEFEIRRCRRRQPHPGRQLHRVRGVPPPPVS